MRQGKENFWKKDEKGEKSRKCNEVKLAGAPVGYAGVPAK